MQTSRKSRRLPVVAVIAALTAGCSSGRLVVSPAPDLSAFAETDAIIVLAEVGGVIRAPRNVISGRDDGAALEAKKTLKNCCGDPLAVLFLPVGIAMMATIGAARAHSPGETSSARLTFEKVANDPTPRASLVGRVANLIGTKAPGAWSCVATVSATDHNPCPNARTPAMLMLNVQFWSSGNGAGRKAYDPAVKLIGFVEASLTRGEDEPIVLRWRYDGPARTYFSLVQDNGQPIRAEIETMLNELATAVVRDLFLDPRPVSLKMRRGQGVNAAWIKPVGTLNSFARRLMPGEVAPASFGSDGRAAVTTKVGGPGLGGCTISEIAGRSSFSGDSVSRLPEGARIAYVSAGHNVISLSCPSADAKTREPREIVLWAEPRRLYCTDGKTITETNAPHRC